MDKKRILYVVQEMTPYVPATPAALAGNETAVGLAQQGAEVRTFMPKYGCVNERRNQLHEVIRLSGSNISIADQDHPLIIKVASLQPSRIQVYFTDNDDYFEKSAEDMNAVGSNRADNDERTIFFARGTMETIKKLRWEASVMHCVGWMTALTPVFARRTCNSDPAVKATKIVYTVTPEEVQAPINPKLVEKLRSSGIPAKDLKAFRGLEPDTKTLHKLALLHSDAAVFLTDEPDPELLEIVTARKMPYITREEAARGGEAYMELYGKIVKSK